MAKSKQSSGKCENCSNSFKSVYHIMGEKCPKDRTEGPYIWVKDEEPAIYKADRFLKQYCGERKGAKGWV